MSLHGALHVEEGIRERLYESDMNHLFFEIFQTDDLPGKLFFQLVSGGTLNRCTLESIGTFCDVQGRMLVSKANNGKNLMTIPYRCSLASAENIIVKELTHHRHQIPEHVPQYIRPKKIYRIRGTKLPAHIPVEAITIDIILGSYRGKTTDAFGRSEKKDIWLLKASLLFKSYESIHPNIPQKLQYGTTSSSDYMIQDVLFDKMLLFAVNVTLPEPLHSTPEQQFPKLSPELLALSNQYQQQYAVPSFAGRFASPTHPNHSHSEALEGGMFRTPSSSSNRYESTPRINSATHRFYIRFEKLLLKSKYYFEAVFTLFCFLVWYILRYAFMSKRYVSAGIQLPSPTYTLRDTIIVIILIALISSLRFSMLWCIRNLQERAYVSTMISNKKSFFVNGWNAWSYCGSVLHGKKPPMYAMPSLFVKAFHDGGVGTSLPINSGNGEIPFPWHYSTTLKTDLIRSKDDHNHDHSVPIQPEQPTDQIQQHKDLPDRSYIFSQFDRLMYKDYIASDMFTLLADTTSQYGLLIGFLSQKQQFGCIASNIHYNRLSVWVSGDGVVIPSQGQIHTDYVVMYAVNELELPFKVYMQMSAEENQVNEYFHQTNIIEKLVDSHSTYRNEKDTKQVHKHSLHRKYDRYESITSIIPMGWCSWYHYFQKISEDKLVSNITIMDRIRKVFHWAPINAPNNVQSDKSVSGNFLSSLFQLFQIDDGYQAAWGDWTQVTTNYCPAQSLSATVESVKSKGCLSGIWLAPFAADTHAQVSKKHPSWILRNSWSRPANSANCGKFFYGLDITNPEVQKYLEECFRVLYSIWGFRYFKFDFLYACILGQTNANSFHRGRTMTRAQIIQFGMKFLNTTIRTLRDEQKMYRDSHPKDGVEYPNQAQAKIEENYFLLGCGAPLGSMIGHVHANRISAGKEFFKLCIKFLNRLY